MATIADKAIAKAEKAINDAIEKLEYEQHEAQRDYWDTGYDRYYNKLHRLEDELEKLRKYTDSRDDAERYRRKWQNMEKGLSLYEKKLDDLKVELTGEVPENQIEWIIGAAKSRLMLAMDEAERY